MTIPETPEARNEASREFRPGGRIERNALVISRRNGAVPACANNSGA